MYHRIPNILKIYSVYGTPKKTHFNQFSKQNSTLILLPYIIFPDYDDVSMNILHCTEKPEKDLGGQFSHMDWP